MPLTPEAFTIYAQGVPLSITVLDAVSGDPVDNCYVDLDGETPVEWPLVDYDPSVPVTLYFTASDPPQIRSPYRAVIRSDESATDYLVSATFNGVEVAGDSAVVSVEAHTWVPLEVLTVDLGGQSLELSQLLPATSFRGGDVPNHTQFDAGVAIGVGAAEGDDGGGLTFKNDDGHGTLKLYDFGGGAGPYIVWQNADDGHVRAYYWGGNADGYLHFKGSWLQDADQADGRDTDPVLFGIFGGQLAIDVRPAIATQVGVVDVDAFNALRTALISLGLVIDGD